MFETGAYQLDPLLLDQSELLLLDQSELLLDDQLELDQSELPNEDCPKGVPPMSTPRPGSIHSPVD